MGFRGGIVKVSEKTSRGEEACGGASKPQNLISSHSRPVRNLVYDDPVFAH